MEKMQNKKRIIESRISLSFYPHIFHYRTVPVQLKKKKNWHKMSMKNFNSNITFFFHKKLKIKNCNQKYSTKKSSLVRVVLLVSRSPSHVSTVSLSLTSLASFNTGCCSCRYSPSLSYIVSILRYISRFTLLLGIILVFFGEWFPDSE